MNKTEKETQRTQDSLYPETGEMIQIYLGSYILSVTPLLIAM